VHALSVHALPVLVDRELVDREIVDRELVGWELVGGELIVVVPLRSHVDRPVYQPGVYAHHDHHAGNDCVQVHEEHV
jgi:hypothetical protein